MEVGTNRKEIRKKRQESGARKFVRRLNYTVIPQLATYWSREMIKIDNGIV
jgi:hypothetical protein